MEACEQPEIARYSAFPIRDEIAYNYYKKAIDSIWFPEHLDAELAKDQAQWPLIPEQIRAAVINVLAFFAVSDGVVNETLEDRLTGRIKSREIQLFYDFQKTMEDIHNISYSKLLEAYIKDPKEKARVFDAILNFPSIAAKIRWIHKTLGDNPSLARVLLTNVIVEGLMFQTSFAIIFWIAELFKVPGKGSMLPGLTKANEWISRDEGLHTEFGTMMYNRCKHRLPEAEVHEIFRGAIEAESMFARETLPTPLKGMNQDLMIQYLKFMADSLLKDLGYSKIYHNKPPQALGFMLKQSTGYRSSDFFTTEVSEYRASATATANQDEIMPDPDDENFE